ncbi:MAG: rod shape-determining protein MreD [Eggerthellaceae bacterium]|nr:rod shape-determining protein MreD [Eggerthellaceae bacterium]
MANVATEVIGAVIAFLLQALIAPYLAINDVTPNICFAFAISFIAATGKRGACVMPFLMGLSYDLLGSGPVGGYAVLTLAACTALAYLMDHLGNDSWPQALAFICAMALLASALYALLCVTCGWDVGLGEALLYRALPMWLYDTVFAIVFYPLVRLALRLSAQDQEMTSIG